MYTKNSKKLQDAIELLTPLFKKLINSLPYILGLRAPEQNDVADALLCNTRFTKNSTHFFKG